ncbi:succinylglutamate desuccinylase/aspartoacylase family protein [Pseudoduganella sp. OTU4001]|uniref:succinylglutamate desuccinylase/aspartoacylase family protein n=1 Tax=Pseudoduganella sp. OTU4001 TaxID=3043854 RepID=UPI00313BEE47
MQTIRHPISASHGSVHSELTSYRFGQPGGRKAYIQAALHADEVPAMLVAQSLRTRLQMLEQQGRVLGEVVLVPAANPLGLAQVINERPFGRFDLATGINYNRGYPALGAPLAQALAGQLGPDADANVRLVRARLRELVEAWPASSNVNQLKKTLLGMAIDADVVLDLHCDNEAALHIYASSHQVAELEPLARLMQASALLHSSVAGGDPFDEACFRPWSELAAQLGAQTPLPLACLAATIELRGEVQVDYATAANDAYAILRYLALQGILQLDESGLPPASCRPTPLEGTQRLDAPHAGMLVYLRALGDQVAAGDAIADLIDPTSGETTTLRASVDGVFFARLSHRYVIRGMNVGKIAGVQPFREGNLLSL